MDFSLTTMFVLPVGNTLPTTGSTEDLLPSQFGAFLPDHTVATAANIAAAKYFYFAQGRPTPVPGVGTKKSDLIDKTKIKRWFKYVSELDVPNESVVVSNFSVQCGEDVTISLVTHSNYTDLAFFNGRTQSVTVTAPCCDCGADPCADIDAADIQAMVDQFVTKFQQNPITNAYNEFYRQGTGAASQLVIVGKPITADGRLCSDLAVNTYWYDRLWFRVFAYTGPATSADFLVYDACDQVADVTITSRALYAHGTSDQILQREQEFYSYQSPALKMLFRNTGWNQLYTSEVVPGQAYDWYYLEFIPYNVDYHWTSYVLQDAAVILAIPTGQTAVIEALLTPALGAPEDKSAANVTTTTSTSTSSTSTSTTTVLQP